MTSPYDDEGRNGTITNANANQCLSNALFATKALAAYSAFASWAWSTFAADDIDDGGEAWNMTMQIQRRNRKKNLSMA